LASNYANKIEFHQGALGEHGEINEPQSGEAAKGKKSFQDSEFSFQVRQSTGFHLTLEA